IKFSLSSCFSADAKLLEEAVVPLAKTLIQNNSRSGNFAALVRVFLGRTKELKISTECQDQLFIWQAHNALFLVRCLLKVFIREMSEEDLHLQFSYQARAPGTYESNSGDLLEELICNLVHLIVEVPLLDITYNILFEAVTTLLVLLSYQLFQKEILREGLVYRCLTRGRCLSLTSRLVKTLLYNFIRQEKCPPPAHIFTPQADGGGLLYGLASGVASGLWSVFTLGGAGSKSGVDQEQNPLPLSNQSLLLLLVLANLPDGLDCPNPYKQAVTCFKNTQDTSSIPSPQPHTFQINFNSLYTALCEQQRSDQATLLLYTLLHQNPNMKTYMLSRTDVENLVMPILEILYHVEERNSHHVYMALIILLILTEDDTFNRSIHEVILKNINWYTERALTEISLGSLLILVVIRTIQFNMTRTRDKYLHTNCLAALANMSAQFRCLHQYAAQRIIRCVHASPSVCVFMGIRWMSDHATSCLSNVIGFFSQRLEQAGTDLSVETVQEVIKKGAVALPKDRLKYKHTLQQILRYSDTQIHKYSVSRYLFYLIIKYVFFIIGSKTQNSMVLPQTKKLYICPV
uniref:Dymeclin n=1 Tax=Astyanax mexicanus TaxID=7994 RepID=A0A8B9HU68_ASTMX